MSDDPSLVAYFEGTSIVYQESKQEFVLYKGTNVTETIQFTDYVEPDISHKVVAYIMENGKTVDKYISEKDKIPENIPTNKKMCQIPEDTIVAKFMYNGVLDTGIDREADNLIESVMKKAGFNLCGSGYDIPLNVRDLVFDKRLK